MFLYILSVVFILYFIPISIISLTKRCLFETELSDKEIYKKVEEEIENLNLGEEKVVEIKVTDKICRSKCKKKSENKYLVKIADNSLGRSPGTIKHEIYHVHKGDCERHDIPLFSIRTLKYLFIEEPRANIYDIFSIHL